MNTLGNNLRITTFGESHGPAMGGVIDGFPSGFKIDFGQLEDELRKRKPGGSSLVTARNESDSPEFLSGISRDGITLGTPIGFIIRNSDHHSKDYDDLKDVYRPSHADFTYMEKYGIRDHRGGGRASARETVNWVVAGAIAMQWLEKKGITIESVLSGVGNVICKDIFKDVLGGKRDSSLDIPDHLKDEMRNLILKAKGEGDSVGGRVSCLVKGFPRGYGDPVFNKISSALAKAMISINAAKGFEIGGGFEMSETFGSQVADSFLYDKEESAIFTSTNYSGGIQGGISNGMPIFFNVAFKPTPTIAKPVSTVDKNGNQIILKSRGRHDPCVAVRAVPVVKALTALVLADFLL